MREKLIEWQKENGFRTGYIIEKLGISYSTWSLWKSGKREPSIEQLYKFSDEFEATIPDGNVLKLFEKF